jgi:hypothetical protein
MSTDERKDARKLRRKEEKMLRNPRYAADAKKTHRKSKDEQNNGGIRGKFLSRTRRRTRTRTMGSDKC